jgi:hypothetical protein
VGIFTLPSPDAKRALHGKVCLVQAEPVQRNLGYSGFEDYKLVAVADEDALKDCCRQHAIFAGLARCAYRVHRLQENDLPEGVSTCGDRLGREHGELLCAYYDAA